ncbi:hypothetical protein BJ508DRAFT_381824 [Ascobolus immersus RN42]|uniref:Uncharacterized protein n=1 Tax=Ascobolus immersus RN42 TaxID=1160509 RepID=A0A3N4HC03_ASCIM|nr:hypothetical protein BJ508DRAFT_381824 [Ascobolus immersus RN42]
MGGNCDNRTAEDFFGTNIGLTPRPARRLGCAGNATFAAEQYAANVRTRMNISGIKVAIDLLIFCDDAGIHVSSNVVKYSDSRSIQQQYKIVRLSALAQHKPYKPDYRTQSSLLLLPFTSSFSTIHTTISLTNSTHYTTNTMAPPFCDNNNKGYKLIKKTDEDYKHLKVCTTCAKDLWTKAAKSGALLAAECNQCWARICIRCAEDTAPEKEGRHM